MKSLNLVLTICFLAFGSSSFAQTEPSRKDNAYPATAPVSKGYYSIGNHAGKLSRPATIKVASTAAYPVVKKGYYSIGNNNRKLGRQLMIEGAKPVTPVATKGYYSIERKPDSEKQ